MKIFLMGASGGIGSAIKERLSQHTITETIEPVDWIICAQGFIGEDDVEQTFAANTILSIKLTQKMLPELSRGVIYISSTSGIKGNTKFPAYSASKAALNFYAGILARTYPELQFYSVCPGPTDTKMWRNLRLEGKTQDPIEVAKVVERILNGEFKSGDIITVRNGVVSV